MHPRVTPESKQDPVSWLAVGNRSGSQWRSRGRRFPPRSKRCGTMGRYRSHISQRSDNEAFHTHPRSSPVVEVEPPTLIDYVSQMEDWPIASPIPSGIKVSRSWLIKVEQDLRCAAGSLAGSGHFGCTVRRTPRGALGLDWNTTGK